MSDEVEITSRKSKTSKNHENLGYKIIIGIVSVIVIGVIGFYIGVSYQKHHTGGVATSANDGFGG
jgi:cation transporter-like permease